MTEYELIVTRGKRKGLRYQLKNEQVKIGRSADNDIVLEEELVSRYHCLILKEDNNNYKLMDLGSTNKTLLNNEEVVEGSLKIGDQIQIADTLFLFTTVKDGETILEEEEEHKGKRVITVTEMKILPDVNKLLDVSTLTDNLPSLRRAHRDLVVIYKLGSLINTIQDTKELLDVLAEQLISLLQSDRVVIMLFELGTNKVIEKIIRTKNSKIVNIDSISMSMVYESFAEGMAFLSYDALTDQRFKSKQSVILNKIRSAMCAPIKGRNQILGVIYVDTNISVGKFTEQDLQLLSIVGNQAGVAIQNARLYEDLDELFTGSLKTLVATIEAKDMVTSGHSVRVTVFSLAIAKELSLDKNMLRILKISSLLHDIGKIAVPESILGKPASLSEDETIMMKEHPIRGAEIIKNIKNVDEVVTAVRHHHEYYDGAGIPDGLEKEEIPLASRIIAVADAFDAITFDRPYRKGIKMDKALKEIQRCSGSQFDPQVVDALSKAYHKGMLDEIPKEC